MRLKEIKPGMVIHCKNDEEKKALLEEAERLGYVWYNSKMKPTKIPTRDIYNIIHFYGANKQNGFTEDYKHITHSGKNEENVTEFSDLILPELTAEEALQITSEICKNTSHCVDCPIHGNCYRDCDSDKGKVVEVLCKWKSEHEKKEPEIEWVYRVFGAENYGEKFFQTEEEAIKRCEELAKSQKTKQYARYERVCRVKEV